MKAITAHIYAAKNFPNCSNHGISARFDEVYVPHPDGNYNVSPDTENLVKVEREDLGFCVRVRAIPYKDGGKWWMMGGCYISSSDSRFSEACYGERIIPLHDRCEW